MYSDRMPTRFLRSLATLAVAAGTVVAAHAQLPVDNPVWKTRCNLLAASAADINKGATPASLVAATRGVGGAKFLSLAAEASNDGNHTVACTLFYLSAIADRAGNGGKTDASAADTASTLAASEVKLLHGGSLSMSDHMTWTGLKFTLMRASAVTSNEAIAALDAAQTMPLSLSNAAPVQMADATRNKKR